MAVARRALTGEVKGQGHRVMKCADGVGMYVDITAEISSCSERSEHFIAEKQRAFNVLWKNFLNVC